MTRSHKATSSTVRRGVISADPAVLTFLYLSGILDTKIVGVQYYRGHATPGEYVVVRREPSNPYDSNALRVENVQRAQIGHIPRTVASKLAKYMVRRLALHVCEMLMSFYSSRILGHYWWRGPSQVASDLTIVQSS